MGGRQSSSSVSNASSAAGSSAILAQGDRNSPQRRAVMSGASSSGFASSGLDSATLRDLELSEDTANILQRLSVSNAARARSRSSLPSASTTSVTSASHRVRSRTSIGSNGHAVRAAANSDDAQEVSSSESDDEEDDEDEETERHTASSHRPAPVPSRGGRRLPFRFGLLPVNGIKCPICKQVQQPSDFELHLVMCLTKPRVTYNEDVLTADKDEECSICLEEFKQGTCIARLPCLCVFHKRCVDDWFRVRQMCPNHPGD